MHRGQSADHGIVPDLHMPCERRRVRKNDVVADEAIVRDMRVGEKIAVAADPRHGMLRGAAMNADELAEGIVLPDGEMSRFARVFEVLRRQTDRTESVKLVPGSD